MFTEGSWPHVAAQRAQTKTNVGLGPRSQCTAAAYASDLSFSLSLLVPASSHPHSSRSFRSLSLPTYTRPTHSLELSPSSPPPFPQQMQAPPFPLCSNGIQRMVTARSFLIFVSQASDPHQKERTNPPCISGFSTSAGVKKSEN